MLWSPSHSSQLSRLPGIRFFCYRDLTVNILMEREAHHPFPLPSHPFHVLVLVLTFPLWVPGSQQLHQINSEGWSHLSACRELASGGQPSVSGDYKTTSGDYKDHIWTWPSAGGPCDRMSSEFHHQSSFVPLLWGWAAHHLPQFFICSKKTTDPCSQVRAPMSATTFP